MVSPSDTKIAEIMVDRDLTVEIDLLGHHDYASNQDNGRYDLANFQLVLNGQLP